jgi:hypothetical protein
MGNTIVQLRGLFIFGPIAEQLSPRSAVIVGVTDEWTGIIS